MHAGDPAEQLAAHATKLYIRALWLLMPAAWIVRQVFAAQHRVDSDGIGYIDIAYQCVHGNWHALVNGYWSPGYPALVSLWLSALHPSPYREVLVVRVFNCIALLVALISFRFFINTVLNRSHLTADAEHSGTALPRWAILAVGYTLFFWTTTVLFPIDVNGPDILVLATLLLTAAISTQIVDGKTDWRRYALLGVLLGVGYLIKAALLPLAPVFLVTTFLGTRRRPRAISGLLLTAIVLGIVSAPFIYALSKAKGRFTFGDSGAINYAKAVNYIDTTVYWQGDPPGSGIPKHPVRKLLDSPPVYEYAYPIPGSYPLWYDNSYWYDGVRPHLQWKRQINVIHQGLHDYYEIIGGQLAALAAVYLVLLFISDSLKSNAMRLLRWFPLWGPALAGFAMYALVHVEPRYLNGFIILLWAACFLPLRLRFPEAAPAVIRGAVLAVVIVVGAQIGNEVGHRYSEAAASRGYPDWEVAQQLHSMGIEPGDKVSFVGDTLTNHLWAHLTRVTIVSEVPFRGEAAFWAATAQRRSQVLDLFAQSGAKAVVAKEIPPELGSHNVERVMEMPEDAAAQGWAKVPGTDYYTLRLPQQHEAKRE